MSLLGTVFNHELIHVRVYCSSVAVFNISIHAALVRRISSLFCFGLFMEFIWNNKETTEYNQPYALCSSS